MEQDEQLLRNLKKSGLSDKAAQVYAHLLTVGGAYPSAIATKTRLNRSTTYKILTELSIQGLINEIEKGKKLYYQVENPSKLLRFAKRRIEAADDAYEQLEQVYPELQALYAPQNRAKILYFEGPEAVLSIYDDHVASDTPYEMLGMANTDEVLKFLEPKYFAKYRRAKERIGITSRGIMPETATGLEYSSETYADTNDRIKPTIRFLPKDQFPLKGEITIYAESKVSIINLENTPPIGIIIEDVAFHKMMVTIFNLAWIGAKEV